MDQIAALSLSSLGSQIRLHREHLGLTQQGLVDLIGGGVNRSHVSYLEQGTRLPSQPTLKAICEKIGLPDPIWKPFANEKFTKRLHFEGLLSELIGAPVTVSDLDENVIGVLEAQIDKLVPGNLSVENSLVALNSILVFYAIRPLTTPFYERYLKHSLTSFESFQRAIEGFQTDAIRLFSTISDAYKVLNSADPEMFLNLLHPLQPRNIDDYSKRSDWTVIEKIPNPELPYLGYIAARRVREEASQRQELSGFLLEIAGKIRDGTFNVDDYSKKKKRRMDSLLRDFESRIPHGLFSTLFKPDAETLEKEADYISPKQAENLAVMEQTQKKAYQNLSNYLSSDYLDVYVATSMRGKADFISVNDFVESLFSETEIAHLRLRYFNPTQSWIEDRVAKGLVEALMLRRASMCIYMAQKDDTFGKDSEASVTLGQGKPVIVYVPRLFDEESGINTEEFGKLDRALLIEKIQELSEEEIDDAEDNESLQGRLLTLKLENLGVPDYIRIVKRHWADFDLESEFSKRIDDEQDLAEIKNWFDTILATDEHIDLDESLQPYLVSTLVGSAIRFEGRAKLFREVHPLALQVILTTGVLNGILVVRSFQSCATLVRHLIENRLETQLETDDNNYRLIEKNTRSTIRVISKHRLISNAFRTYY